MVDERHLIIAGQNFRTLRNSRTTHRGGRGYAGASEPRACPVLNRPPTKHLLHAALLACALPWAGAAWAQNDARVVAGINAYRAAPASCPGMLPAPAPALAAQAALARVRLGPGTFPEWALEQAGYHTDKAQVIHVGGAPDADAVLDLLRKQYCRSLLDAAFTDVGVARSGNAWTIVLARPTPPLVLPGQDEAGRIILDLVNAARAQARNCGAQYFGAAPPLAWNAQLALAALAHSSDMAEHRQFSHHGSDGSEAAQRATRAGYRWRHIGENIAAGQTSPQEAVQGWIDSPGHCANLMNPQFREMGAGYAVSHVRFPGFPYWTQVFAMP